MSNSDADHKDSSILAKDPRPIVAEAQPNARKPMAATRWVRRLAFVSLVIGLGWMYREPMLIASAEFLIVDGPSQPANVVVVIDEGDRRFDYVADRYRSDSDVVLVYRRRATRLERWGITPTTDETARRELLQRGFSGDRLQLLPEAPLGKSKFVAALSQWLAEHPDRTVDLLCDRFNSRTWDLLLRRAEKSQLKERIAIVPLTNRHYDETNWWRSKRGTRAFLNAYFTLGFHYIRGGAEPEWKERDSGEFCRAALGCSADESLGRQKILIVSPDVGARSDPPMKLARK